MTSVDSYSHVKCRVVQVTRNAVLIDIVNSPWTRHEWIPLSLIHGADELALKLGNTMRSDTLTLRIMTWKVRELGL